MSKYFEELDYQITPIGALSLRRRLELKTGQQIYEIKLGEEYLMSSMFTASEKALAKLGLAALDCPNPDIVVGGLGLGYTAQAVLTEPSVNSLIIVEYLQTVIDWHQSGLLPLGSQLQSDSRCKIQQDDFFRIAVSQNGFGTKKDAILVDIDHSPDFYLDQANAEFYQTENLSAMAGHLRPGGIFGLWSDALPDNRFTTRLNQVFDTAWVEPVTFYNPLQNNEFTQCVYLARTKPQ